MNSGLDFGKILFVIVLITVIGTTGIFKISEFLLSKVNSDNKITIKKCLQYSKNDGKCIKAIGEHNETILYYKGTK